MRTKIETKGTVSVEIKTTTALCTSCDLYLKDMSKGLCLAQQSGLSSDTIAACNDLKLYRKRKHGL